MKPTQGEKHNTGEEPNTEDSRLSWKMAQGEEPNIEDRRLN